MPAISAMCVVFRFDKSVGLDMHADLKMCRFRHACWMWHTCQFWHARWTRCGIGPNTCAASDVSDTHCLTRMHFRHMCLPSTCIALHTFARHAYCLTCVRFWHVCSLDTHVALHVCRFWHACLLDTRVALHTCCFTCVQFPTHVLLDTRASFDTCVALHVSCFWHACSLDTCVALHACRFWRPCCWARMLGCHMCHFHHACCVGLVRSKPVWSCINQSELL